MADIIPKELIELPYVDRQPDPAERPDQRRIQWIMNGECLGAAESPADNGGELNRGPVQVQKNVVTLLTNDKILEESLTEVITRVNAHDVTLGQIGDDNLATKVENLENQVTPLDERITQNSQEIFLLQESDKDIEARLGTRPAEDTTTRNVMEDLLFTKQEIGNWDGKDFNGLDLAGNPASGLKARIVAQGLGIASNERRIKKLEDDWLQSDVAALQAEIDQVRAEVGPTAQKPLNKTVYQWISDADTEHQQTKDSIDEINRIIGGATGQTIDERITENTTKISELTNRVDPIELDVANMKAQIGNDSTPTTILNRLNNAETTLTAMEIVVGRTETDGLRKAVADVTAKVGSDATENTLMWRTSNLETNMTTTQRELATVKLQVGSNTPNAETGLFGRVRSVEVEVVGADGISGLKADVTKLKTDMTKKIDDAVDDKRYVRSKGSWVDLGNITGIAEAPADGKDYVRNDTNWVVANRDGVIIPNEKSLQFSNGASSFVVMSYNQSATNLIFGSDDKKLSLKGQIDSFSTTPTFQLSDQSNGVYFVRNQTDVQFGGDNYRVRLMTGNTAGLEPAVNDATGDHKIWHEGNFPDNDTPTAMVRVSGTWAKLTDHIPPIVRARGGYYFKNNTQETTLVKDTATKGLINVPLENFDFNQMVTTSLADGLEYTGTDTRYLHFTCQALITDADPASEIAFCLFVNDNLTNVCHVVKGNEWNTDGSAYINVAFPYKALPNDKFSIRATLKNDPTKKTIVMKEASVYVMEM